MYNVFNNELRRFNQPTTEFERVIEYFIRNIDESKTEKRLDDSRDSITTLLTGFASGHQAAQCFSEREENRTKKV